MPTKDSSGSPGGINRFCTPYDVADTGDGEEVSGKLISSHLGLDNLFGPLYDGIMALWTQSNQPTPSGTPSRAALYLRVSTNPQEEVGSSLETQEIACRKYCTQHGLTPEFILRETWSGLTLDRPQLNQLRELARSGRIDFIVIHDTDRQSRDPLHLLLLLEEFDKAGVDSRFVLEPRDNSEAGKLLTYVRGFASKIEALKIAERTQRGRRARAKEGKLPTGTRRYGWDYIPETGKRAINEREAGVVREMVSWVVNEGLSLGAIRARLMERGVPAPKGGETWSLSTVRRILKDPALVGDSFGYRYLCVEPRNGSRPGRRYTKTRREERPREEWILLPEATPPIVSRETFDALQQRLRRNSELTPRAQKYQYLLAGFLWCGACGSRYYGEPQGAKRYYRCAGRRSVSERCRNPQIGADSLETDICAWFDRLWLQPDLLRLALLRYNKPRDRRTLQDKLEAVSRRMEKLNAEERRLLHCYVKGEFSERILDREKSRITSEHARISEERDALLQSLDDVASSELDEEALQQLQDLMAKRWQFMSFAERRQVFDRLKLKVEIMPDRSITVSGLLPMQPDLIKAKVHDEFPQYVGVDNPHL